MTKDEFEKAFSMLETAFGEQSIARRRFFYQQFEQVPESVFMRAVKQIIETREDRFAFPLVAEINSAISEIYRQSPSPTLRDIEDLDYCQQCDNLGFYLNSNSKAVFCNCRRGRLKRAVFALGTSATRAEIDEYIRTKLPPPCPPVRGLKQFNNETGFWETNAEEHERFMNKKQLEIEQIKQINEERKRKLLSLNADEEGFKTFEKIIRDIRSKDFRSEREPGEDG